MLRALWSMLVAWTWLRSKFAYRAVSKANARWNAAVKVLGLKPGAKESFESQAKYWVASSGVDQLGERVNVLAKRSADRARRHKAVANFGPRWFWSYVPYAEISALGVAVGWLAHNKPEVLSYWLNVGVGLASKAWVFADTISGSARDGFAGLKGGDLAFGAISTTVVGTVAYCLYRAIRSDPSSPFSERAS